MSLSHEEHVELAVREIRQLADVAAEVDPATPAPTCGDWTVADVLRHTGQINRWAAAMVRDLAPSRYERDEMDLGEPEADDDLPAWLEAGAGIVRDAFLDADPAAGMWAWGVPKAVGFWPRRMIHETGVHRADVELAAGRTPAYEPVVACDGIDELLDNLPEAAYFRPNVAELTGDGEVVGLVATDTDAAWRIVLEPGGFTWSRAPRPEVAGEADALAEAPSGELLLAVYRRIELAPVGSAELWEHWWTNSAL